MRSLHPGSELTRCPPSCLSVRSGIMLLLG
nr:MAG TPA: maltose-binding periplasmic protein [Caudoviricetes sp.]